MKRSRRGIGIGQVAFLLLGIIGVGVAATAQAQSPTSEGKVTFTIGVSDDMVTANPFKSAGGNEYEMFFLNYDMLYNFSQKTLEPESALAQYPPEESADGKTWTFEIRSGVTWSDGVPLTAHDIAFTYNLINEKGLGAFQSEIGDPIAKNAFEAPNDTTLIWHMETATLAPLSPPWVPIVPEHIWGKYMDPQYTSTDIKGFLNVPAVGSGPFHLNEWDEGQGWKMEANPDYWMGAPHIDEVVFRKYGNYEALKLALTTGEVDAVDGLPPSIFNSLQGEPNIATNVSSPGRWDNLAFNFEGTGDPSFHDEEVRDAIALAIDRQALVDRVTLGYATIGDTVIPSTFSRWSWQPSAGEVQGYDPQAAMDLLDSAGYKDVDGDGIREDKSGNPWSLEVLTIADYVNSVPAGKLIVGWLNDIGIDTTIKSVSEGKGYDQWGSQNFDMYVWSYGVSPDPDFILSIFTHSAGSTGDKCIYWSDGCYSDPVYDEMWAAQRAATDPATRQELVTQMQQYLYDKNPEIILFDEVSLEAYRTDRFTGFLKQPEPQGYIYFGWGPYSYLNIEPVLAADGGTNGSSAGIPVAVWVLLAVAVVLIGATVVMRRRNRDADTE